MNFSLGLTTEMLWEVEIQVAKSHSETEVWVTGQAMRFLTPAG